jgi:protein SCO1/2
MKRVLIFAAIFIAAVLFGYFILKQPDPLPIYNPADINPDLVDESLRKKTRDHRVGEFKLINQLGDTITQERFEDKIYVADFFFTSCQTICPKMSSKMAELQKEFSGNDRIMFLSHSVTPQADSVPALADYAVRYEVDPNQWMLTTGAKQHIYKLAREDYFAVLDEGDGGEQDFIHTENFVLVDPDKRLRGFYDGTSDEDIQKLKGDIRNLLEEYENK